VSDSNDGESPMSSSVPSPAEERKLTGGSVWSRAQGGGTPTAVRGGLSSQNPEFWIHLVHEGEAMRHEVSEEEMRVLQLIADAARMTVWS
jgi:hypothetical protein